MATRTNKSGQRKSLTIGLAAFASVCLIATGFAAWIISTKTEEKVDGNVAIGAVSNANVEINVTTEAKDRAFSFNPKSDDDKGRIRYDGTNAEKLGFTLEGKVGPERFVTSFKVRLDIAKEEGEEGNKKWVIDTEANNRFTTAATTTKNYLVLPSCFGQDVELIGSTDKNYTYTGSASVTDTDKSMADFSAKIEFGWGIAFNKLNPGNYYDEDDKGKLVDDATRTNTMNDFYTVLTGNTVTAGETLQDVKLHFLLTISAGTSQTTK